MVQSHAEAGRLPTRIHGLPTLRRDALRSSHPTAAGYGCQPLSIHVRVDRRVDVMVF
jgi:hypothetical protein